MEDFISYSKIAELLTKALRDELTDEEREVLERWRHEASVHEAFYRRVNTPEFLEEHPQHRFEGEIAEAWGRLYVRHRSRRSCRTHQHACCQYYHCFPLHSQFHLIYLLLFYVSEFHSKIGCFYLSHTSPIRSKNTFPLFYMKHSFPLCQFLPLSSPAACSIAFPKI